MTFEADLKTLLTAVTPRVYPGFAPTTTTRPYVTYQHLGGDIINLVENSPPGKRNSVMQINVWSDTLMEALQISRAIEDALRISTPFICRPLRAAGSSFDADIPVYLAHQDFSCWHSS